MTPQGLQAGKQEDAQDACTSNACQLICCVLCKLKTKTINAEALT